MDQLINALSDPLVLPIAVIGVIGLAAYLLARVLPAAGKLLALMASAWALAGGIAVASRHAGATFAWIARHIANWTWRAAKPYRPHGDPWPTASQERWRLLLVCL